MAPDITTATANAAVRSTKATGGNNRAYVTFLTDDGHYVKGCDGFSQGTAEGGKCISIGSCRATGCIG